MAVQWVNPKRRKRYRREEDSSSRPRVHRNGDRFGLMALQRQVGNRAIQQMMIQRQAAAPTQETDEATAKLPLDAGMIKVEKPEIEEYDVDGANAADAAEQLLPPEQWYEYEYQYNPKVENGKVVQVEIIVKVKIRLPKWVGAGWDNASDAEKLAWLGMLHNLAGNTDEEYEAMGQVPRQWAGMDWKQAPEKLKSEWQGLLQEMHSSEQKRLDIILRRLFVLQQRMLNRPEDQANTIFDRFLQDVAIEEEAYGKERIFGQEKKIALGTDVLMQ